MVENLHVTREECDARVDRTTTFIFSFRSMMYKDTFESLSDV